MSKSTPSICYLSFLPHFQLEDARNGLNRVCFIARWVKVTVAVGEESEEAVKRQRLQADSDVLALEQPGRVTG